MNLPGGRPAPAFPALAGKRLRSQYAALCFRRTGRAAEILLITSRGKGRWILPKGWPMAGKSPSATAAQEAWEEAGVIGRAGEDCVGVYGLGKRGGRAARLVLVYPVEVAALALDYPECGERLRRWFAPREAAARVDLPELAGLLRGFDSDRLAARPLS